MVGLVNIPNETSNQVLYAGFEDVPGVAATPDFRLKGDFAASEEAALDRAPEVTGGYDRFATPRQGPSTFAGTYGENLTYETLPQLMRAGLRSGAAGVQVGGAAAYQYTKAPRFDRDDVESMTVQHYVPGLGMQAKGVRFNEWTIAIDADDAAGAWKFSSSLFLRGLDELPGAVEGTSTASTATTLTVPSSGWTANQYVGAFIFLNPGTHDGQVREISANTATVTGSSTITVSEPFSPVPAATVPFRIEGLFPAGVPNPMNETIDAPGTKLFLDPVGSLGTNQVMDRLISANVTVGLNLAPKRFLEHNRNEISARVGKGDRVVSGRARLEHDRRDEWLQWRRRTERALRLEQIGSEIATGTNKRARIDLPRVLWDSVSPDTRQSNLTATYAFLAFLPASAPIITVDTINGLATLP